MKKYSYETFFVPIHVSLSLNTLTEFADTIQEVIKMDKKIEKQQQEQSAKNKFNNQAKKTKPENQNQTHNVRKEGIQPINQKK